MTLTPSESSLGMGQTGVKVLLTPLNEQMRRNKIIESEVPDD